jgi:hypothetical protein
VIDAIRLLSEKEARAVVSSLDELRPVWVMRGAGRVFATLGRAAYLDLCGGRHTVAEYRELAAPQNEILLRHFGPLLETIRALIERVVQKETVLTTEWALPGFHVFLGGGLGGAGTGGAHFDLQFRELLEQSRLEGVAPLSYTLALELPRAGSGLRVWPLRPRQLSAGSSNRSGDEPLPEYLARKPSIYVQYQAGMIYLQRDPILHCISNGTPIRPEERRITLQGHGLERGGRVVLYW